MTTPLDPNTDIYKADVNSFTHVYISIASMFVAWFLCCVPAIKTLQYNGIKKYGLIILTILIYCIVIPITMTTTGAIYDTISHENVFAIVKMFSLCIAILLFTFYAAYYGKNGQIGFEKMEFGQKIISVMLVLVLIANILEACWVSYTNKDALEFDGVNEVPEMNIIIFATGILLCISLIIGYFVRRNQIMTASIKGNTINIVSDLSWAFILGYTFWNLAYRIQLIENTSVLIFFFVSLLLPIIAHKTGMGDWLHIRALTLLFVMIVTLGITPNGGSILPMYNLQGYNKKQDNGDPITALQKDKSVKIILLVLGLVFTVMSLFESCTKTKILEKFI